jgi:hypothetical protein
MRVYESFLFGIIPGSKKERRSPGLFRFEERKKVPGIIPGSKKERRSPGLSQVRRKKKGPRDYSRLEERRKVPGIIPGSKKEGRSPSGAEGPFHLKASQ